MKRCWDSNPANRPSAEEIYEIVYSWLFREKDIEQFNQAEEKRLELIKSRKLGPELTNSVAIYTNILLHPTSINSFSTSLLSNTRQSMYFIMIVIQL